MVENYGKPDIGWHLCALVCYQDQQKYDESDIMVFDNENDCKEVYCVYQLDTTRRK